MGRYLQIKKYQEEDGIHYYIVSSPDYLDVHPYFLGIDSQKRCVSYFKANDFEKADCHYYLDNPQELKIDWLPSFFIYAALVKAKEALDKNTFREYISFYS